MWAIEVPVHDCACEGRPLVAASVGVVWARLAHVLAAWQMPLAQCKCRAAVKTCNRVHAWRDNAHKWSRPGHLAAPEALHSWPWVVVTFIGILSCVGSTASAPRTSNAFEPELLVTACCVLLPLARLMQACRWQRNSAVNAFVTAWRIRQGSAPRCWTPVRRKHYSLTSSSTGNTCPKRLLYMRSCTLIRNQRREKIPRQRSGILVRTQPHYVDELLHGMLLTSQGNLRICVSRNKHAQHHLRSHLHMQCCHHTSLRACSSCARANCMLTRLQMQIRVTGQLFSQSQHVSARTTRCAGELDVL